LNLKPRLRATNFRFVNSVTLANHFFVETYATIFLPKHSGMCSHGPGREDHIARFKFKFELWMQLERDRKKARPGGTKSVFMLLLHIPQYP